MWSQMADKPDFCLEYRVTDSIDISQYCRLGEMILMLNLFCRHLCSASLIGFSLKASSIIINKCTRSYIRDISIPSFDCKYYIDSGLFKNSSCIFLVADCLIIYLKAKIFVGVIFHWTNCMARIKLHKLSSAKHIYQVYILRGGFQFLSCFLVLE